MHALGGMHHLPVWLDGAIIAWFFTVAVSTACVAWDAFGGPTGLNVMSWAWILVTLFTGPLGAALYLLAGKDPGGRMREAFVRSPWNQAIGSTVHCVAGDGAGVLAGAVAAHALHLPMWADLLLEYIFGFGIGLFVFQSLFMKDMVDMPYGAAVRSSFLPELVSMNGMMAGMLPPMAVLMSRDADAMSPSSAHFWATMSFAMIVGLGTAYPFNRWLVAAGLKHGVYAQRRLVARRKIAPDEGRPSRRRERKGSGSGSMGALCTRVDDGGGARGVVSSPTGLHMAAVSLLSFLAVAAGLLMAALVGDLGMTAEHESSPSTGGVVWSKGVRVESPSIREAMICGSPSAGARDTGGSAVRCKDDP